MKYSFVTNCQRCGANPTRQETAINCTDDVAATKKMRELAKTLLRSWHVVSVTVWRSNASLVDKITLDVLDNS